MSDKRAAGEKFAAQFAVSNSRQAGSDWHANAPCTSTAAYSAIKLPPP